MSSLPSRYARQLVLPEVGPAGQWRLQNARVAVVGCGGLGAPVIQQLAAAGVGTLSLFDDDTVEASNLNRQTLFGVRHLGMRKTEAAAAFVQALNPDVDVHPFTERVTVARARTLFAEHDVVVDCSDGLPTKYLLNDVAVVLDRRLVHGAATAWTGQVLVVPGKRGPCLRCLFPTLPPAATVPTCRTAGILAPVTGVVGSFQAAEVIKMLLMPKAEVGGRLLAVDVKDGQTRTMRFNRDVDCPVCSAGARAVLRDDDYAMPLCADD